MCETNLCPLYLKTQSTRFIEKYFQYSLTLFVESSTCHCINIVIIAKVTATSHKQPIWFREMKGTLLVQCD